MITYKIPLIALALLQAIPSLAQNTNTIDTYITERSRNYTKIFQKFPDSRCDTLWTTEEALKKVKKQDLTEIAYLEYKYVLPSVYRAPLANVLSSAYSEALANGKSIPQVDIVHQFITQVNIEMPEEMEVNIFNKQFFNHKSNNIEDGVKKFAKAFKGDIKEQAFKRKEGKLQKLEIQCLSYKATKYYSYAYTRSLYSDREGSLLVARVTHNLIYDISSKRFLTIADVLTPDVLNTLGISKKDKLDMGIDKYFLYIGKDGKKIATYSLSKENWHLFAPTLQHLIGPKETLPTHISKEMFHYIDSVGIQNNYIQKIIANPYPNRNTIFSYLKQHLQIPDSTFSQDNNRMQANISYTIGANGKLTSLDVKQTMGHPIFKEQLMQHLNKLFTETKPLVLGLEGSVNFHDNIELRYVKPAMAKNTAKEPIRENINVDTSTKVFDVVEQMPEFPGGQAALLKWINENIKYPAIAEENGIQGRVVCTFVVEKDGSTTDVLVARSIDPSLDKEAVRLLKKMPKWIPGKQRGENVRVKYTVPITFRLQ